MLLHHVELWVPDLTRAERSWGWLLTALGAEPYQRWERGRSWRHGDLYVVVEQSPDLVDGGHERRRPGLNHLAFHTDDLDTLVREAPTHGWTLLFADGTRGPAARTTAPRTWRTPTASRSNWSPGDIGVDQLRRPRCILNQRRRWLRTHAGRPT